MLGRHMMMFSDNLEYLREFVDCVAPILFERLIERAKEKKDDFRVMFALMYQAGILTELEDNQRKVIEEIIDREFIKKIEKSADGNEDVTFTIKGDRERSLLNSIKIVGSCQFHEEHLYKSSLISLISMTEFFVSNSLHAYFDLFPDFLSDNKKEFSLAEIKSFKSIEAMSNSIIDAKIENVLRGGIAEWLDFFKLKLKLKIQEIENSRDQLLEIYARRNLLVHNDGIVNSIYLSKVTPSISEKYKANDKIKIDRDYLESSIDCIELCFIVLASKICEKIEEKSEDRADALSEIVYRHLVRERWFLAEGISRLIMGDKTLSEHTRLVGQINYWLSYKLSGRFDLVRDEIITTDFSAKDDRYILAKYALLDDDVKFFELLPKICSSGKITIADIKEWPLFIGMRKSKKFSKAIKKKIKYIE